MKREYVRAAVTGTGIICILGWFGQYMGFIPFWLMEAILVLFVPAFIVFLGLWWMASEGEEDIPFLGY